jgi:hypothetical protein
LAPLGPLDGLFLRGDVEDPEAAEQLLGLTVRPVGDDGRLGGVVDDNAQVPVIETLRGDQDAGRDQLVVEPPHGVDDLGEVDVLVGGVGLIGRAHDQHVLHGLLLLCPGSPSDPLMHGSNGGTIESTSPRTNSVDRLRSEAVLFWL